MGVDRSGDQPTFTVPISTGIFQHWRQLGSAALLFICYVDKTTEEVTGDDGTRVGKVYGGVPCRDADVARAFGCSRRTILRWRNRLIKFGYICAKRTPVGFSIGVLKSKKWRKGREGVMEQAGHIRSDIPVTSDVTAVSLPYRHNNDNTRTPNARTATKPADAPLAFSGEVLKITGRQGRAFIEAFPHLDLPREYAKADAWLVAHADRKVKRLSQFMYQWLAKCPAPWFSKQRQEPEWM